nr:LptA/OstA family protein [uncultured Treponema sp.]
MKTIRQQLLCMICACAVTGALCAAPVKITFSADKMQGTGVKGKNATALTGNAQVHVDSLAIYGEQIELYGKDYRYIKASGGVKGDDSEKGFTFSASSLMYDRETEVAEFMGAAKVEDTKNKVETAAERIEYNQKNEIILLQMAVNLKSKDIVCDSLFAVYNRTTSMLELTGKPAVKKGKDIFKAARISVNLDTEDIRLEGKVSGSVTEEKKNAAKSDTQKNANTSGGKEAANAASREKRSLSTKTVSKSDTAASSAEKTTSAEKTAPTEKPAQRNNRIPERTKKE